MSEQAAASLWERSSIVRFFRWLFSWRGISRIVILLLWIVTIVALFYGEENWRGRRTWNKMRREIEARGEKLDFKAFIPPPVADEQNFAATPFIRSWFDRGIQANQLWGDDYSRAESKVTAFKQKGDRGTRHFRDLVAWAAAFNSLKSGQTNDQQKFDSAERDRESREKAAPAVLEGFKSSESRLSELRTASARPYSHYPIVYKMEDPWGILLPHLARVKSACQRLQIKACAELASARSDAAFKDVTLMLYLADSVKEESTLISYLVRVACVRIAAQPVWEGLAEHRWSEAQLRDLQSRFTRYDFLRDIEHPLHSERAAGILTADLLHRGKYRLTNLQTEYTDEAFFGGNNIFGGEILNLIGRAAPHGWYYREQVNYCRLYDGQFRGTYDISSRRVFPRVIQANDKELERVIAGGRSGKMFNAIVHHHVIAAMLIPALERVPIRAATGQTEADEAALACALERYRMAHGEFPENLDALVPQLMPKLPTDLFSGQPYKYERTSKDHFLLYSIGANERDDGGEPGATLVDDRQGDWVWEYPK